MNYTALLMTLMILTLGVFMPVAAIAFVMIKSNSGGDDFGLGAVSLQDELQRFLAEFEHGTVTAETVAHREPRSAS